MRCLVLGGGGFLGSHLCDVLAHEGHEVTVFERPNLDRHNVAPNSYHRWIDGDFANQEDMLEATRDIDVIYHLISTTLPKTSNDNPVYDVESNLVATLRLLDAARRNQVRKIVFVSSGGTVYGTPEQLPIAENHPANPICSYGITKLAIEHFLNLYHVLHGLNYVVVRLSNPYGERQRPHSIQGAISVFMRKALSDETIEIWGDGSVVRDYIHVEDVATALLKAMTYDGGQHVFNIGSGIGHSLNQIVSAISQALGRPLAVNYLPARNFDVPVNILDIRQARQELGWAPSIDFDHGIQRTAEWMKHYLGNA